MTPEERIVRAIHAMYCERPAFCELTRDERNQGAAVVAAVRSWPPEAQAELIGGDVERITRGYFTDTTPAAARVVGPWTSTLEDKQP